MSDAMRLSNTGSLFSVFASWDVRAIAFFSNLVIVWCVVDDKIQSDLTGSQCVCRQRRLRRSGSISSRLCSGYDLTVETIQLINDSLRLLVGHARLNLRFDRSDFCTDVDT